MKHLQTCTDTEKNTAVTACLVCPGVHDADSGGLGFRSVHERFNPSCSVYEFRGSYDVLHPAVFHLREEAQSSYFCIRHSTEEEHQRCPIFSLLA